MDELTWIKSSFSGPYSDNCVEVATDPTTGTRHVRNSKQPDAGMAIFTPPEWVAFVRGVKAGEFDG